ncbi:uncharacterized protein METZ01_LOCUS148783 [marine metagenome]|uniref:Uncharacterized protein n=1 Tax=marine metagenome TaxID=408172 RepID=A0A382A3H4_9ZZZZ
MGHTVSTLIDRPQISKGRGDVQWYGIFANEGC